MLSGRGLAVTVFTTAMLVFVPAAVAGDGPDTIFDETPGGVDYGIGDSTGGGAGDGTNVDNGGGGPALDDEVDGVCEGAERGGGGAGRECSADTPRGNDSGEDAEAIARSVRDRMVFPKPQLHTSPEDPVKALVGLETWLWVPEAQWRTQTQSLTLGGTTVTVNARPILATWDMGEKTVYCGTAGRVWRKGLGQNAKTSCGYTYKHTSVKQPAKKYTVSVQLRYAVSWTCTGDCSQSGGTLDPISGLASTSQLQVSERQSVVISR